MKFSGRMKAAPPRKKLNEDNFMSGDNRITA